MVRMCLLTQGAALGYVVLPLRGVPLTTFDTLPTFLPLISIFYEPTPVLIPFSFRYHASLCAARA